MNNDMDSEELLRPQLNFVPMAWVVSILLGIVAFFLTVTFFTVQQTAKDVSLIKTNIAVIQVNYNGLNERVNQLELNQKK